MKSSILILATTVIFIGCNSTQKQPFSKETRILTKNSSLVNFEIIDLDADNSIDQVYIYTYDNNLNLIKKEFEYIFNQHYMYRAYLYTYDQFSNKTQEIIKDQSGDILYRSNYYYDEQSNLISMDVDNDNDSIVDIMYSFTYDKDGRIIKKESDYNADGLADYTNEYIYDDTFGVLSKEILLKQNDPNSTISTFYTYDNNLNLTKKEQDINSDGVVEYIISYIYDQNNRLIQEFYNSPNIKNSFKYFYDTNQNLIKKEQYNSDNRLINISTYLY